MAQAKRTAAQRANDKRLGEMSRARAAGRKPAKAATSHAKKTTHHKSAALAKPSNVVVLRERAPAPAAKKKPAASRASKAKASAGRAMKLGKGLMDDVLIPSVIGGGAAAAIDVAYGAVKQFLPASVADHKVGKPLIKFAAGVGIGLGLQHFKILKPAIAKAVAVGVGNVQVYQAINDAVSKNTPVQVNGMGMTLGDLGTVLPGELNGLEALGMLAAGDAALGTVLPYAVDEAA